MKHSTFRWLSCVTALVALGLVTLPAGPLRAQTQGAPKASESVRFGVVDIQRILRESAATRAIRPQIEKLKNDYQGQFKREEEELRAADQDLQRQRTILSPDAFDERRRDFQRRATELQRRVQEARRTLDEALGGAMQIVQRAVGEIVTDMAAEQKIQFIMHKQAVMLMDARFDITDEVLKRLNAKVPSVQVKLPQRKPAAGGR